MFSLNRNRLRWFLVSLLIFDLLFLARLCSAQGFVNVALESVGSTRTAYTYVFSGLVTCGSRPCANALVDVDLETPTQGAIDQTTRTGEDGRYQMAITVYGSPEDSSLWKVQARSSSLSARQSAPAEGRIILMEDQKTVAVDRSLLLTQA